MKDICKQEIDIMISQYSIWLFSVHLFLSPHLISFSILLWDHSANRLVFRAKRFWEKSV